MALRNYLYAKHLKDMLNIVRSDDLQQNREKRRERRKIRLKPKIHRSIINSSGCGSGREIVLEDGTKLCRNCVDCSKKNKEEKKFIEDGDLDQSQPKLSVEVQDHKARESATIINQLEKTHLDSEIDFTHSFKKDVN